MTTIPAKGNGGTRNALERRIRNPEYRDLYFVGDGIDIGSGGDPLWTYREHFPRMTSCVNYDFAIDLAHDTAKLPGLNMIFDFVHSSHCLEHLDNAYGVIERWVEICRPGGFVIVIVPDRYLYEKDYWPSKYNADHKNYFTMHRLASHLTCYNADLISLQLLHDCYRYPTDRDYTPMGQEAGIEFILKKR